LAGFYLGLFALAPAKRMGLFWGGVAFGFAFMLWTGFEQRFGGLEATRQYVYSQPGWENLPPENLKRLGSNRIFATLLYPNTLAGVILLLLPPLLIAIWQQATWLTPAARGTVAGAVGVGGLACLYWSGSKAGWLIALVMLAIVLLRVRVARRWRAALVVGVIALGVGGFFIRFSGYFQRGATSVSARGHYWRAAWRSFLDNPILGTGPGTFAVSYRRVKPPEAEMARLVHNDYLEQASDSGLVGFATYSAFVLGLMVVLYRRVGADRMRFAVWLGLSGWVLQSGVEFGLYIPALGGTAFWLLGWLWGTGENGCAPPSPPSLEPSPGGGRSSKPTMMAGGA
jgi:O-antigen ligase